MIFDVKLSGLLCENSQINWLKQKIRKNDC